MIKGKTRSGFEFQLDENVMNNMELIEGLAAVDQGDITALPKVLVKLLGSETKEALYNHVRSEDGRVPIDLLVEEVKEIFSASKEIKN
ncbi:MAG: hypothetical protein IKW28_00975 [Lachnospiraceae bacterium]|nr:hypothetical protein [Lachnospiraceae bacterium]